MFLIKRKKNKDSGTLEKECPVEIVWSLNHWGSVEYPRQICSDPSARHQGCLLWDLANSDSVLGLHHCLLLNITDLADL